MNLKQAIVVKSEYTVKGSSGKGSRGSTPGDYVTRYMSRADAVEPINVKRESADDYVVRYMARRDAVEKLDVDRKGLKSEFKRIQRLGGIGFGKSRDSDLNNMSFSDEELRKIAHDINSSFDEGKTVFKTIVSFDEEYLREMGIISEDFKCQRPGDYRGNIDQLKLRVALASGVDKLSRGFDDLEWVGTVQVDTTHVHAHLALVDTGDGRIVSDGTQKGKLTARDITLIRRGIDESLTDSSKLVTYSKSVTDERANVKSHVKAHASRLVLDKSFTQNLLAALPKNKTKWRAASNAKDMRKANNLVKNFVTDTFKTAQGSRVYKKARDSVRSYAKYRQTHEGISKREYSKVIRRGENAIIHDAMNGVYDEIRKLDDTKKVVSTPMIDIANTDMDVLKNISHDDPTIEFGFKLRSYSSRLNHHTDQKHKMKARIDNYKNTPENNVNKASLVMLDFYNYEFDYNRMLMSKYQYFLSFMPPGDKYKEEVDEIMLRKNRIAQSRELLNDIYAPTKPNEIKVYAKLEYDIDNGEEYLTDRDAVIRRIEHQERVDAEVTSQFKSKLEDYGLVIDDLGNLSIGTSFDFDDVKALDLHHLGYDFEGDVSVSEDNLKKFVAATDARVSRAKAVVKYLMATGQEDEIEDTLDMQDILIMQKTSRDIKDNILKSKKKEIESEIEHIKTVRVDEDARDTLERASIRVVEDLVREDELVLEDDNFEV